MTRKTWLVGSSRDGQTVIGVTVDGTLRRFRALVARTRRDLVQRDMTVTDWATHGDAQQAVKRAAGHE